MDTAKVDIEKLQLLNDRIVQMIDALNQVRMSVHGLQARQQGQIPSAALGGLGLSHSGGAFSPWVQQSPWQQNPWQQNPWQQYAHYPQTAIPGIGGFGLSHTGYDPYRQGAVDPMVYARIVQTFPFLVTEAQNTRQFF